MVIFIWVVLILATLITLFGLSLFRFGGGEHMGKPIATFGGVVVVIFVTWLVAATSSPSPETGVAVAAAAVSSSSESTTTTATRTAAPTSGTGTPPAGACPTEYVQNFDPNEGYKFYSAGVQTSADDLTYLGHDARTLAFRAYSMKLTPSPDPSTLLTPDGTCLSQEGQNAYLMTKGALTASGTTIDENGQAPEDGVNTGMEGGKAVVSSAPGIYGDRAAIIYTLADGTVVIVLKRCGNLVFRGTIPEGIAIGNTDNPPPPAVETPPPAETTPVTEYTPPTTAYTPPTVVTTTPNDSKIASEGAAAQGNVPEQVTGYNPPPARDASPPSVDSPAPEYTYVAPAPPPAAAPSVAPTTVARSTPPAAPVTGAPASSDPATGCVPPPGKTSC